MKTLVVYYSNKGSNKFLAHKISKSLQCDIEEIKPRINVFLFFIMNIHMGNRRMKHNIEEYERIILCGPIWMGKFISPLRSFVKHYVDKIKQLVFVTCCGSTFDKKDDKFGHGLVFKEVESMLNGKCKYCQAFPIDLVVPEHLKDQEDAFMKTHLNDANFNGKIQELYDEFIEKINGLN